MTKISFCTTCKGRLWQLEQTLTKNLNRTLKEQIDIVVLDYHSPDGLEEYIRKYKEYLEDGRLKYYKLVTFIEGFDMAYAKHVVHTLYTGTVLFNLDSDNTIGDTLISELESLKENEILIPKGIPNTSTSRCGRLGLHKVSYKRVGGYDVSIRGMSGDDGDLVARCWSKGMKIIKGKDEEIPIQQSKAEKLKYKLEKLNILPNFIIVEDYFGKIYSINLRAQEVLEITDMYKSVTKKVSF